MTQELQSLLDRIQNDAFDKINEEKEKILSRARKDASRILVEAKDEAEKILKNATGEAKLISNKAEDAIKQAARDLIIGLQGDLESKIRKIVKENIGETMTPEFMGKIILEIAKNKKTAENINIIVNKKDLDGLECMLKNSLAAELKLNPEITIAGDFSAGLKIGFKGEEVYLDFSDNALTDMICGYVGRRIAAIIIKT
jgi:V/A-type H+-transporting ATPase subunit E